MTASRSPAQHIGDGRLDGVPIGGLLMLQLSYQRRERPAAASLAPTMRPDGDAAASFMAQFSTRFAHHASL